MIEKRRLKKEDYLFILNLLKDNISFDNKEKIENDLIMLD